MRHQLEREAPEHLELRMWLFPYLTYFAIAAMVAVIGAMALVEDVRAQLIRASFAGGRVGRVLAEDRSGRQEVAVPAGSA